MLKRYIASCFTALTLQAFHTAIFTIFEAATSPPLIERTFLLRCLGNNAFEYLAQNRGDNRRSPVYCKEDLRTRDWFSKIEIA